MKVTDIKDFVPLGQHVLIERDNEASDFMLSKSGILTPTGIIEDEGLIFGLVLHAPEDQNLLIDKTRPINTIKIEEGMHVWYSKYSAKRVVDWRQRDGSFLDIVPLEDLMAVVKV
jgi:co-chaperonin GroES (HSP10)